MQNNIQQGLKLAVSEVIEQFEIPSPAELVMQLSEIEARKRKLMKMLDWCSEAISKPIDDEQYQMLMDFMYLQSAKKNIDSGELVAELQFKYMQDDLRELPAYSLWDAMTFIKKFE